jgi:hypothetical protein
MVVPEIIVEYTSQKYYNLFLDGVKTDYGFYHSKKGLERYLKRRFDIDLRTDGRIIKNYKEYTTRKISEKKGQAYYIKKIL